MRPGQQVKNKAHTPELSLEAENKAHKSCLKLLCFVAWHIIKTFLRYSDPVVQLSHLSSYFGTCQTLSNPYNCPFILLLTTLRTKCTLAT